MFLNDYFEQFSAPKNADFVTYQYTQDILYFDRTRNISTYIPFIHMHTYIYILSNICCAYIDGTEYNIITPSVLHTIHAIISWQRLRQHFCVPQVVKGHIHICIICISCKCSLRHAAIP